MVLMAVTAAAAAMAAIYDWRTQRIPNRLTGVMILSGVSANLAIGGLAGGLLSLAGLALGVALFIGFYWYGSLGGGDVKLLGAIGALLGPSGVWTVAFYTVIFGGLYAVGAVIAFLWQRRTASAPSRPRDLCYAIPIALATVTVWFLDERGAGL
jgi:prepilin peptidase CpaA